MASERVESKTVSNDHNVSNSCFSLRKIEFHPARKQYNINTSASDFRIETLNADSSRKKLPGLNLSLSVKQAAGSDFHENGLDPDLAFGITFRKIGAGLENLGNTCFLNSVLQCLTYTEPLAAYLQSGKHQTSCHIAGFCALCAIQKHVSRALQSTGRSLVPKDLVSNLRCISRNFRNARQEDAHEYMVNLLESMHKCCLPSGVPSESPAAYEKSLVHKIFGGRLRSQVECQQCSYCSNKYDPFLDLSLEIAKADTLPVALRNFTAAELLDGGEKHYQCQKCKQKVRAKKRLTVHSAPNVLTIHLKRFHAHDPGRKVDKKVLFGRSLDMKPFVSGSYEGDLTYSLYGVLVHFGHGTHSGHYVCFVCTSSGIWYLLNDNEVRPVSEKAVLDQKAYMLFYVRDRKIDVPKMPANVFRKENMKASVSNNSTDLVSKQITKEQVDKSSFGNNRSLAADSATSVNKKAALNFSASKEIPQKEAFGQPPISECQLGKRNYIAEPSSSSLLSKNTPKEVYPNPELGDILSHAASSMNSRRDIAEVDNATTKTVSKMSDSKASSNCNRIQNSPMEKLITDDSSEKINLPLNVVVDGAEAEASGIPPSNSSDKMSNKINSINSLDKTTCGSNKVYGLSNLPTSKNSVGNQDVDSDKQTANELAELSIPSVRPHKCTLKKDPDFTPPKKLKKLLKYRFANMHVGLKFFKSSLRLRKKKKHKKSKCRTLTTQNLIVEQVLEGNCSTSGLGPSTSKISMSVSSSSKKSQRRKEKSHSKCRVDSVMGTVDEEFEKRNNQNGDAVSMDKYTNNSVSVSISEVNHHNMSDLDFREAARKNVPENGTIRPEETTVARWDEVELPWSEIVEQSMENIHIGYVPDEWDEEYDRGKQKKVRQNKHEFGGSNPFQEFASKQKHFKKAKTDRSSSRKKQFWL